MILRLRSHLITSLWGQTFHARFLNRRWQLRLAFSHNCTYRYSVAPNARFTGKFQFSIFYPLTTHQRDVITLATEHHHLIKRTGQLVKDLPQGWQDEHNHIRRGKGSNRKTLLNTALNQTTSHVTRCPRMISLTESRSLAAPASRLGKMFLPFVHFIDQPIRPHSATPIFQLLPASEISAQRGRFPVRMCTTCLTKDAIGNFHFSMSFVITLKRMHRFYSYSVSTS